MRSCPRTYPHPPTRRNQGPFPPAGLSDPPSQVLRAPRTPSRHEPTSPPAYRVRLRPTWAAEEGLSCSVLDCPCVPSSLPREGPVHRRFPMHSLLPSPRNDGLGPSAFRLLSHEAARFTLSHSARRFAPLARNPTAPGGLSTLRSDGQDLSHRPEPATRRSGLLTATGLAPASPAQLSGRTIKWSLSPMIIDAGPCLQSKAGAAFAADVAARPPRAGLSRRK